MRALPLVFLAILAACGRTAAPTSPTSAPAPRTPTLLPPAPVSPADGATYPGTVRVANSVRTESLGSIVYEFEFSTASSFDTVYRLGTASETPAETSLQIYLATGSRFFWRARAVAESSGISSAWSAVSTFTTAPGCAQFEPPIPIAPVADEPVGVRPTLSARDGRYSGTAYAMTLAYEIALDRSFRQVLITGRPHPMFRSTFTPPTELSPNTRYFWRVHAYNTKVCTSVGDFSPPQSFITGGQE